MSDDTIKLDFSKAKVKLDNRTRGRMKVTIKLNKDEAIAFSNMKASLVPEGVNDDVFLKSVFFMGLEQFHKNAMQKVQEYVRENKDKLREEGVDVDSILTSAPTDEPTNDDN